MIAPRIAKKLSFLVLTVGVLSFSASGSPSLSRAEVAGYSSHSQPIHIYGDDKSPSVAGGVISQALSDEPAININFYNYNRGYNGSAEVDVYQANQEGLLQFLTYSKEGAQKSPTPQDLTFVTTIKHQLKAENTKLLLPVIGPGIWFLRVRYQSASAASFLIRAGIGVLAKEGDNELVFWAQDFLTRRSVSGGVVRLYNLADQSRELATAPLSSEGVAKLPLLKEADVALVSRDNDLALVPLNLYYLAPNFTDYRYYSYYPKTKSTKYFVFTDRPIYRPGDRVYFKTVLRDDDDARYSVPQGEIKAEIFQGYGEENRVFTKNFSISSAGTITGEYLLPEGARTGSYSLVVGLGSSNRARWYRPDNEISFQVEFYRKPEYTLEISTPKTELMAKDTSSFKISGQYFSGQPLGQQKVKYRIFSADFYNYSYYNDLQYHLSDDYRYGFWSGQTRKEGEVTLGPKGEAEVDLETSLDFAKGKSQIFSVEAEFNDGSGNPVFARKNILVFAGEYGIYRQDSFWGSQVGKPISLEVILVPHRGTSVLGVPLTAAVHRTNWISYQEPEKKYPSYRKEEEDLPSLQAVSDGGGKASFIFTPAKVGSYEFRVEGKDQRGNLVSQNFSIWVTDRATPFYEPSGTAPSALDIRADKTQYLPSETATLTISSAVPSRDLFFSFDRGRMNRYQIVHLHGSVAELEMPLTTTDIPNIYASVSSFSDQAFDTAWLNLPVSAEGKKLTAKLTPDRQKYGPGETVTLNVETTDSGGNPVSADTAVWAVDKAIFELASQKPADIFAKFWAERSNNTASSHSLEGIWFQGGAEAGGCFAQGTKVLLAGGREKNIEEIEKGEFVLTRSSENQAQLIKAKVVDTHAVEERGYLIINDTLKVTPNHYLFVNGGWQEAGSVQIGDHLLNSLDKPVVVRSLEWQAGKVKVYNLQVEKYRTFFANGLWVHNDKGEARTIFKDTAYWNPRVTTDGSGRAQLRFKLPDNLTTWVVATIGSTSDTRVGQTTAEILVSKDVIIRPILPNILRLGDKASISALVQNFTPQTHLFDLDFKFDGGKVTGYAPSPLSLTAGDFQQVSWQIIPDKELEKAQLTFSAKDPKQPSASDSLVWEIPLRALGFWEKTAQTGEGAKDFAIKLFSDGDPQKAKVTLSLSSTILGTLPSAMIYLLHYPYGCTEQTTSSLAPAVVAKAYPEVFAEAVAKSKKDLEKIILRATERLAGFQHDDGGWGWWSSGGTDIFITSYVVENLVRAKDTGAEISPSILQKAQEFLEGVTLTIYDPQTGRMLNTRVPLSPSEAAVRAYALSWLNSAKAPKQIGDFDQLTPDFVALAVMANVRHGDKNPASNGLNKLVSLAQIQGDGAFWSAGKKWYFGSVDASTALALKALVAAKADQELATKAARFLIRNRRNYYWSNTFATAQVIQALTDFSRWQEESAANYSYQVQLDGQKLSSGQVKGLNLKPILVEIPAQKIKTSGSTLSLIQEGEGPLYATLLQEEFRAAKNSPAVNHGLSVKREYVSEKGENYSLAVGDVVEVKITLGGLQGEEFYGVIADELPAGLVPVNWSLANEQYAKSRPDYDWNYGITDREVTENGMVLSLYRVPAGEKTYSYKARVVIEGEFYAPPATASLMYAPEIYGRSETQKVVTAKTAKFSPRQPLEKIIEKVKIQPKTFVSWVTLGIPVLIIVAVVYYLRGRTKIPPLPPVNPS